MILRHFDIKVNAHALKNYLLRLRDTLFTFAAMKIINVNITQKSLLHVTHVIKNISRNNGYNHIML